MQPMDSSSHQLFNILKMNFIYQTNWLYNFVRCQKLKYFGHVTRHNSLEKTIMQGMVAGKRRRRKPRQRWEKDITDTFGTMTAASRVAEDRHQFRRDNWAADRSILYPLRCKCDACRIAIATVMLNYSQYGASRLK